MFMCEEDKVNLRHWSKVRFLLLSHHNHRIGWKVPDPRSVPKRQLDPLLFKCLLFVLKPKCNATIRPEHVNIQPPVSACPVCLNFISDDYYNNKDTMNYSVCVSMSSCPVFIHVFFFCQSRCSRSSYWRTWSWIGHTLQNCLSTSFASPWNGKKQRETQKYLE